MGNIVENLKDKLDVTIAGVKSDIGVFLQQESRVRRLTPGLAREGLLSRIKEIEQRATATLASASALSEQIGTFDPWNVSSYSRLASVTPKAVEMTTTLMEIKGDMSALVRDSDAAVGGRMPQYTAPQPVKAVPRWLLYTGLAAVPLGFLVVGALEAKRRFRGGR
jgi:hypothetical protein